jgi:streptomycin 6-kinase
MRIGSKLSDQLIKNIIDIYGKEGLKWLNQLENLVPFFIKKWQLNRVRPINNSSYNFVAYTYSDTYKCEAVLKISIPTREFLQEQKALLYYEGTSCVKLLDYDELRGGMLLEAISPGTTLKTLFPNDDIQAIYQTAKIIKNIHESEVLTCLISQYPTVKYWDSDLESFIGHSVIGFKAEKAYHLHHYLFNSQSKLYLLHGDLHQDNVLQNNTGGWTAIDPKGVIGELACEIGAFIRNPMPEILEYNNIEQILEKRFLHFSNLLKIKKQRLIDWSYVQAVLASCWAIQDKHKWMPWDRIADFIEKQGISNVDRL